ncbi:MAG: ABC transporter ATP-binding protein [Eubacteriales bacterium]|nr:ABC transporter ATP-binding protein [Eubacteriales bacterium]
MTNNENKFKKSDINTLKWVYSVCKKQGWYVVAITVVNVINAISMVLFADFSKKIINAAAIDHSWELAIKYAVEFFVLIMFQMVLTLTSKSLTERCRCKLEWILKQHMLCTVMKKDYAQASKYHTGDLQNRMFNDVMIISNGFTVILPDVIYFVTKLLCAFAYLVAMDKIFALVFFVGGVLVFLCSTIFRKTIKRLHKRVQETEGKTRSFIQEILTSLLVIKSFVVEDKVAKEADELQNVNFVAKMKRRFFGIMVNAGLTFVFSLGYVFAIVFGAYRLINGALNYGEIIAMLQMVNQIQQPFATLSALLPQYFSLLASAERLMEIEALPDEESDKEDYVDVTDTYGKLDYIDFDRISFAYDRDIILDDTSLKINKGDFVAIMGISGIGKSTLLKLLLGVFKVSSGDINLITADGKMPVDFHTRRLFSYVPQGNFLLSGTIRDNLTFINSDVTDDEINEAIRISCSDKFINDLPDGLNTVIGERGIGLSEGQLQRLAIARSILSKSPIMLLDEATSALDEDTELRFLQNLKDMKDKTCIIVSHKRAALEICNKHIQIIDSKIVMEEK